MAEKPEIRIGANFDGVHQKVDDLGKKIDDALQPQEVKVDTSEATKAIDALEQAVEDLGAAADAAGKKAQEAGKSIVPRGAVDDLKKLNAELEKARRTQQVLAREKIKVNSDQVSAASQKYDAWAASGARGTKALQGQSFHDFVGGGWRDTALNEVDARRTRNQVLRAVGIAPAGSGPTSLSAFAAHALAQTGRGVAGQITPNMGLGGQIMQQGAVQAAGAGGMFSAAGLGRLAAGGLIGGAAYGAMKLVGGVVGKVGGAQDEGMARSDMLRSIGATVDEFDRLRTASEALAHGLSLTAADATALARSYGSGAGVGQGDRGRIYGEAGQAGAFARGTGLDVAGTVGQFAELRRTGQEAPDRLGKSIADAISRRGDFGRLSEVLSGLTGFSSSVAGASLTRGNTDNVLEAAAKLAQLHLPGMGTAEGLGHMAAMDAGFRGGAGGDAGDQLVLQGLQRMGLPTTGYDIKNVREAGLLANVSDVFGRNSPAYLAANGRGDGRETGRLDQMATGQGTVLDMVFRGLQGRYGGNTQELSAAMASITGSSGGDANALIAAMSRGGGIGGISGRLKGMGLWRPDMTVQQMIQANGALTSSDAELQQRRTDVLKRGGLSQGDQDSLQTSDPRELRRALTAIASRETDTTEGEKTRQSLSTIQQAVDRMASKLASLLEPLRDAAVKLALKLGAINQDQADDYMPGARAARLRDQKSAIDKELEDRNANPQRRRVSLFYPGSTKDNDEYDAKLKARSDALGSDIQAEDLRTQRLADPDGPSAQAAAAEAGRREDQVATLAAKPSPYDRFFEKASRQYGVSVADLKLTAARESGMNPNARSALNADGSVDIGLMQHNSKYLGERFDDPKDALDPEDSIMAAAKLMSQLLKANGGDRRAMFRGYNGSGARAENYADEQIQASAILGARRDAKIGGTPRAPAPDWAATGGAKGSTDSIKVNRTEQHHIVWLKDPAGQTIGQFGTDQDYSGMPVPAGVSKGGRG